MLYLAKDLNYIFEKSECLEDMAADSEGYLKTYHIRHKGGASYPILVYFINQQGPSRVI